ncbi:MAG: hypothetical protein AAF986_01935 [Pseudomonadota bacterium]
MSTEVPKEHARDKAWSQIQSHSDVTFIGDHSIRLAVSQPLTGNIHNLEKILLGRAAGEALLNEAPYFAITHLNYGNRSLSDLFLIRGSDEAITDWIGSYEDLLAARAEADFTNGLERPLTYKSVVAVVTLLQEEPSKAKKAFDTNKVYESLLADRIEQKHIDKRKRLWFRSR